MDIAQVKPRFATGGADWTPAKNLAAAVYGLESDYFSTLEVWSSGSRVLVAIWGVDSTAGSETRSFHCFEGGKATQVEGMNWSLPVEGESSRPGWGIRKIWKQASGGELQLVKGEFVNEFERPIAKPRFEAEDKEKLQWTPALGPIQDLKIPPDVLK